MIKKVVGGGGGGVIFNTKSLLYRTPIFAPVNLKTYATPETSNRIQIGMWTRNLE